MLLIKHQFFSLFLFILISCNKEWSYNEKQVFMNTCPDLKDSCECQYQIAYKNFTYEEFNSILNQNSDEVIRNRVNKLKNDFSDCNN